MECPTMSFSKFVAQPSNFAFWVDTYHKSQEFQRFPQNFLISYDSKS